MAKRGRRSGIASDDYQLAALRQQGTHNGCAKCTNLAERTIPIGYVRRITKIKQALLGERLLDHCGHGETTDATVEDADRRTRHHDLATYGMFIFFFTMGITSSPRSTRA